VSLAPAKHENAPVQDRPAVGGIVSSQVKSPGTDGLITAQTKPLSEGAGILPIPGLVYYTADQLTKRPQAVVVPELDPAATRSIIVSGAMILQLRINNLGQVVDVEVEQNELPEIFAVTVTNAFRNSRFTPGERDGQQVNSLMRIEVRYDDKRLAGH
jgi:Gram-negative bacterial TonB protein C-terminal